MIPSFLAGFYEASDLQFDLKKICQRFDFQFVESQLILISTDFGRTTIGQSGAADQLIPHLVAVLRPESHVQRDFLRIGIGAAEPLEVTGISLRRIGIPCAHDCVPQCALERFVPLVETVLPFQEGRFRGRKFFAAKFNAHGSSFLSGPARLNPLRQGDNTMDGARGARG